MSDIPVKEFLTRFIQGDMSVITDTSSGLCINDKTTKIEQILIDGMGKDAFPINDPEEYQSPENQYFNCDLYYGDQLQLRKELAQEILDYLNSEEKDTQQHG